MRSTFALFALSASVATTALAASHGPTVEHRARSLEIREAHPADIDERDFGIVVDEADDDEGWTDLSVGLMLSRDVSPAELSSLQKRSTEGKRDLGQSHILLEVDERGEIKFPRSWEEVKDTMRVVSRRSLTSFSAIITWYTGHDLLAPACLRKSHWSPTDSSLAAALTEIWPQKPACGSYLKLRPKGSSKSVIVRAVDACAGCEKDVPHVDLTKAAFTKLYSLNVGEVSNIQVKVVNKPFSKYTPSIIKLYGPAEL